MSSFLEKWVWGEERLEDRVRRVSLLVVRRLLGEDAAGCAARFKRVEGYVRYRDATGGGDCHAYDVRLAGGP